MTTLREGLLLGMGNPLLDMTVHADEDFLTKYKLKANDAIIGDESHKPLFSEIAEQYQVHYSAGGATQNSLRVAQWVLKKPNIAIFMGGVGKDKYSEILAEKARSDGVNVKYQYHPTEPTGTCAVVITQNEVSHRSLCANLAAANCFTIDHIEKPENKQLVENASYYYIAGFFLTVSPPTILEVARHAASSNKPFMMNLSAVFICQFFKNVLLEVFPYIDILFGNEMELETFAKETQLDVTSRKNSILNIMTLSKINSKRSRIVVITQGHEPVLYGVDGVVHEIPVQQLASHEVIDTNGAGDAFVGGFLSQLIQDQSIEKCIDCGIWAASHIVQQSGCNFNKNLVYQK